MYKMLGLRYFIMLFNNAEYKKMSQDLSLGKLYDVQNEIKIYTKHRLGILIYYDRFLKYIFKVKGIFMYTMICNRVS